jgi:hypothetical protein
MEITVPTLERDTAPQTNCGDDTDGSTMTVLPTWTSWEHAADEQAVAPGGRYQNEAGIIRPDSRPGSDVQ